MSNAESEEPTEVVGAAQSAISAFWVQSARDIEKGSIAAIEEAARQVIALAGFSQTVYFAAVSFSSVKNALETYVSWQQVLLILLLIIPLACWIIALWSAIRVFKPEQYETSLDSATAAKAMINRVVKYKQEELQRAYNALTFGFLVLLIDTVGYLLVFPAK